MTLFSLQLLSGLRTTNTCSCLFKLSRSTKILTHNQGPLAHPAYKNLGINNVSLTVAKSFNKLSKTKSIKEVPLLYK